MNPASQEGGEGESHPQAAETASRGAGAAVVLLEDILGQLGRLSDRVAELEDSVAECVEGQDGLRRAVKDLGKRMAEKKQLKKLKKVLDHLEVIEVGPDDGLVAPRPTRSEK